MSLKYCPNISWEVVRKIMTEFMIETSDEYKARHVACSNLLFVHIVVHPLSAKDKVLTVHCLELHVHVTQIEMN